MPPRSHPLIEHELPTHAFRLCARKTGAHFRTMLYRGAGTGAIDPSSMYDPRHQRWCARAPPQRRAKRRKLGIVKAELRSSPPGEVRRSQAWGRWGAKADGFAVQRGSVRRQFDLSRFSISSLMAKLAAASASRSRGHARTDATGPRRSRRSMSAVLSLQLFKMVGQRINWVSFHWSSKQPSRRRLHRQCATLRRSDCQSATSSAGCRIPCSSIPATMEMLGKARAGTMW